MPWRSLEERGPSLQAGGSRRHTLLFAKWGEVSLLPLPSVLWLNAPVPALAEYNSLHISVCNIITFLWAKWALSPSPGTLQIKLFFCISMTWLLMVVWRFVILHFHLLSSHFRAIVQTPQHHFNTSTYPTSVSATSCSACSQHHECWQNNLREKHKLDWRTVLLLGWLLKSRSWSFTFLKCKLPSGSSLWITPVEVPLLAESN